MNQTRILIPCLAALLMLPFGCTKQPVTPGPNEEVGVSLALSVGGPLQRGTKMAESVTQYSGTPASFRGIDQLIILPFRTGNPGDSPVQAGDEPWDLRLVLPQAGLDASFDNTATANRGLVYTNFAHLYDLVYFRPESDAVLVYGKASDNTGGTLKKRNGSLLAVDLDFLHSTNDILFSPDPIVPSDQSSAEYIAYNNTWKNNTITFLNNIIGVNVSPKGGTPKYYFNDPASYNNHPVLKAALEAFTNEGIYFPLSAEVLGNKLSKLYQTLLPYATDASQSADYYYVPKNGAAYPYIYELAKAVVKKIYDDTVSSAQNTYTNRSTKDGKYVISMKTNGPVAFGLPAGTIPIQWQEGKKTFKIVYNIDNFTGLGYIPADYLCYPPSLWYYVNSPLVSSEDSEITEKYTSQYTWSDIRDNYTASGIGNESKAAAIRNPLQYGIALLELKCKKATTTTVNGKKTVRDFEGNPIDVGNTKFPLTGIIVADQYPQRYDFTASTDASAKMRYIYDSEVNDANGNARAWFSGSTDSSVLTSLVLPTRPGTDVRFALEFLNKTSYTTVIGANGCVIPPGQHFYLAGILKLSEATDNSAEGNHDSVFIRDHVTEVQASFTSLKAAYDVIPDLTEPQLQLGVKAEFGWNLSTPTNVPIVIQ